MSVKYFWCDVVGSSDLFTKLFFRIEDLSSSEVNYFNLIKFFACFEQNILRFEISVHDVVRVTIVDAGQ